MEIVRAVRCKRRRDNAGKSENIIKMCKLVNRKFKKNILDETNQEGSQKRRGKTYCFCNTVYNEDEAYISCDICEDWFHPICVGIPASSTKYINQFVCPICELISARFPNGNRFETSFKRNVDIALLNCDGIPPEALLNKCIRVYR